VPYFGLALYVLIGERPLGRRRLRRRRQMRAPLRARLAQLAAPARAAQAQIEPRQLMLSRLAEASTAMPVLGGARLELVEGASAILTAMRQDIDAAATSCDLVFYIWNEGGLADALGEALERAARRGVRCRVLLDAVGSRPFLRGPWPVRLRAAGVVLAVALSVGPLRAAFVRMDLRMHRKLLVVDGRLAYTGSMNLVDPRFFRQRAGVGEWVDAMLRIEGPPVAELALVFQLDWALETRAEAPHAAGLDAPAPLPPPAGAAAAQVVPSGPDHTRDAIRRLVLTAIYEARRELVITTPYFVPDEAVVVALESAALRGVAVTLIVPERVDSRLVRYASRSFFDSLMAAGVRICEFHGGLLHTKSLTVDGETTLFGTFNLDIRSLRLNFEITLIAYDAELTQQLRRLQADYESRSTTLELAAWRRRPRRRRLLENVVRLASPLL
jgi:cardiolipin synthase